MNKGFTLLEMLAVLTLTAVLFSFAIPFSRSFFLFFQARLLSDQIKNMLRYARNTAVLKHKTLLLLPLTDNNWSSGSVLVEAQSREILHQWDWHVTGWTVQWTGMQAHDYLRFSPNIRQAALSGHFDIGHEGQSLKLIINRIGHIHESA